MTQHEPESIMGQGEQDRPFHFADIPGLLQAARLPALREASDAGLRHLVTALELACAATRGTAIREVLAPKRQIGLDAVASPDIGFASLFAALRSARFEIKRRQSAESRQIASIRRESRRQVLLQEKNGRQPSQAQQPQP